MAHLATSRAAGATGRASKRYKKEKRDKLHRKGCYMRSARLVQVYNAPSATSGYDVVSGDKVATAYEQVGDWVRVSKQHQFPRWVGNVFVHDNGDRDRVADADSQWWRRVCKRGD